MNTKLLSIAVAAVALLLGSPCVKAQSVTKEDKDQAAALVKQMTIDEKIMFISGYNDGFHTAPIERLGIPSIRMADGPQGVRNNTQSTLFPCCLAAAASWNPEAVTAMGEGLGQDSRARGVHILLGPGVNIFRSPLNGRNFEYMGEDPYLAARISVAYIKGIQSQGVMACIKHFALNNQEFDRHHVSSDADERTMNEIYFPTFRAAVEEAKVGSVMSSYNPVNSVHAAENPFLLRTTLRERWGFEGLVMSDWTSTYSSLGAVKNGLDLEMPKAFCFTPELLKPLLESGVITEADLDEKIQHILQTYIAFGFLGREQLDKNIPEDNPKSCQTAYNLAKEASVLLKNDGVLPIVLKKKANIVLMGPHADVIPCGGGSGRVDPIHSATLADGLKGLGKKYPVKVLGAKDSKSVSASDIKAIEAAGAVVVAVGFDKTSEKENSDRSFNLPDAQDELIALAAAHSKKVIVVVFAGGGIDMSKWQDKVAAIVWGWYPGQEGGKAIAEMLAGKYSPSGRLPMTMWTRLEDNPTWDSYYPKEPLTKRGFTGKYVVYTEGVFMGYRGAERKGVTPLYPFGYGLTYSTFEYSKLFVIPTDDGGADVQFTLSNTGNFGASEVAQVYVGEQNPTVARPVKELKAFKKVYLPKGESTVVKLHLDKKSFAYYDESVHNWVANPGKFNIFVGASVADIKLQAEINL